MSKGKGGLLLFRVRVDPARGGERIQRLPFLARGPVEITLRNQLTLLIGENGSGKTTLLEAIAARCAIRPTGGSSYAETEDEREGTAISDAMEVTRVCSLKGLFLRADRFAEVMARAGRLPMPATREWRRADEQSRGEGVLSLLSSTVDASEGMLFVLDEPETGLSPQRQMDLLKLLDELHRNGRSQAIVATHSPILMSHPGCDRLWIDDTGISRRSLEEIPHWQHMRQFMSDPTGALTQSSGSLVNDAVSIGAVAREPSPPAQTPRRPARLWILSDLRLDTVPHPEGYKPNPPSFDVLMVAGNVWKSDCGRALEVVARLARGKPAVFVMGSHELLDGEVQRERQIARRSAERLGITLLDDQEIELAGVSFVGGTLWTDLRLNEPTTMPSCEAEGNIQIADCDGIRPINLTDKAVLHGRTWAVIEAAMARPRDGRLVVMTNHAPPLCHLPPTIRIDRKLASEAPNMTDASAAILWVHGHLQQSIDVVQPDGMRIVCNPAGIGFRNARFQDDLVIEV